MKTCYAVTITYGEYEDRDCVTLAVFESKEAAEKWSSSMDTLLHCAKNDAIQRELQDDYSGINYSLFGIESVKRKLRFGEFHILHGFSFDIEELPLI